MIAFAALAWFWLNSMSALDAARKFGRKACSDLDLQFLDDAIVRTKIIGAAKYTAACVVA